MAVRRAFFIIAGASLALVGLQTSLASASPVAAHTVLKNEHTPSAAQVAGHQNLIFIDSESDDEACDPGEDCSDDTKAAPKHDKKSDKKNKKAGTSSNSNDDCDPGEDCSDDAD